MAWDPEVSRQLHTAFREGNVDNFKQLLQANPSYLRDEDGSEFWMWKAALHGSLPMLQAMVDLGLDVNESHDASDPTDVFYEPEGPILVAAGFGNLEMVRWLLDRGAKINFVVRDHPRCLPLIHAAGEGHLAVVKLLVERGADIDSTWEGLNAVTQAERLGHSNIAEYLRMVLPQ